MVIIKCKRFTDMIMLNFKMADTTVPDQTPKINVAKNAAELQKIRLEKLMKNPAKPVFIPEPSKEYKPRDPLEFIRNVWGSSAGAGSGDFHVYRGVRRREYARQKFAKEKNEKEDADEAFRQKVEANSKAAEERTSKKRAKRLKKKQKQKNNKKQKKDKPQEESEEEEEESEEENDRKNISDNTDCVNGSKKDTVNDTSDANVKKCNEDIESGYNSVEQT